MATYDIIAYNTHLFGEASEILSGNAIAGAATEGYKDEARRGGIVDRIKTSGADLVCLCEVWPSHYQNEIVRTAGFPQSAISSSSHFVGDGLLILSRHKLTEKRFVPFTDLSGSDSWAKKGVLAVRVEPEGGRPFRVFFTHTQANASATEQRFKNIDQIAGLLQSFGSGEPAVVLGDLNVDRKEYKALMGKFPGFTDAFAAVHPGDSGYTFNPERNTMARKFGAGESPDRLDYILASSGDWTVKAADVVIDWKFRDPEKGTLDLSDHYPVRATLALS